MPAPLAPDASSVGTVDRFSGNFTKALYLRSQSAGELERRLGYGPGRLSRGWWLLFALERPAPDNFEFADVKVNVPIEPATFGEPSIAKKP